MEEYACWLIRLNDGAVLSKHVIQATELDGDLVEVITPDLPLRFEMGCVMIMGMAEDVLRLVQALVT
jgi:hypothetical protein